MRPSIKNLTSLCAMLCMSGLALADEPAPPPADPATPEPEPAPTDPQPADPAPVEPAKVEPPKVEPAPAPPFTTTSPSTSPDYDEPSGIEATLDDEPVAGKPRIAIELSMTSGRLGDPYVAYKGYTLENGQAIGTRLEANLIGISLSYELARMSNTEACDLNGTCFTGDFGATTMHVVELGYRYRFSKLGPVRPYLHAGIGGVLANIGDWSMTSSKTIKGGEARAAIGIEIPLLKKFFASAGVAYRFIVTENPLRNKDADTTDKVFVNGSDLPNGDYAEDAHLITGYLGFGVTL